MTVLVREYGVDPNAFTDGGVLEALPLTPMHIAARSNALDTVRALLNLGGNVNAVAPGVLDTPLHYAYVNDHQNMVRLLLESGADADARDREGRAPADRARV